MVTPVKRQPLFSAEGSLAFFIRPYQLIGLAPTNQVLNNGVLQLKKRCKVINIFVLVLFWIGMGFAFARKEYRNNTLSIVSNFIQLALNAVAFSVVFIMPLWKYRAYHEMVQVWKKINGQLRDLHRNTNHHHHKKEKLIFYGSLTTLYLMLIYNHVFDFYVATVQGSVSIAYWILYSIPLLFYGTNFHQAIFIMYLIFRRLRMARRLIQKPKAEKTKRRLGQILEMTPCSCSFDSKEYCDGNCMDSETKEVLSRVISLINDIYLLCERVNAYFGPALLCGFAALFAVTSVQGFYALIIIFDMDETKNQTLWVLIKCVNLIVLNLTLVVLITSLAELVLNEVEKILSTPVLNHRQTKKQIRDWLHPRLSSMRFSASRFFDIDFKTLFGFISAIITYLIILMQSNSMSKETTDELITFTGPKQVIPKEKEVILSLADLLGNNDTHLN